MVASVYLSKDNNFGKHKMPVTREELFESGWLSVWMISGFEHYVQLNGKEAIFLAFEPSGTDIVVHIPGSYETQKVAMDKICKHSAIVNKGNCKDNENALCNYTLNGFSLERNCVGGDYVVSKLPCGGLVRYVPTQNCDQGVPAYDIEAISNEQRLKLEWFYKLFVQPDSDEEDESD